MATSFTDPASAVPYLALHDEAAAELPGYAASWVRALRGLGRERFSALGFPTPRHESYRFTDLKPLTTTRFTSARPGNGASFDRLPSIRPGRAGPRLVFVDGVLRPALSALADLPDGVELASLASLLDGDPDWLGEHLGRTAAVDDQPFVALNTAFLADGVVLKVERGVEVKEPIELVFVTLGREGLATAIHPRLLIVAEANARASLVEHYVGYNGDPAFTNVVAEVVVGDGAHIAHAKFQCESPASLHFAHAAVQIGRDGGYHRFTLQTGGQVARDEVNVRFTGTGGECRLSGAYLARGRSVCDNTTFIDHAVPLCSSREVYKGVLDDAAHGVFQGKILVRPDAQKTDGNQLNRALLLSDTARIDAKPELEIFADDVKCSHGATAGELDDDQLFYLRARGIPLDVARGLLIEAFLGDALAEIDDEVVRDAAGAVVAGWMKGVSAR